MLVMIDSLPQVAGASAIKHAMSVVGQNIDKCTTYFTPLSLNTKISVSTCKSKIFLMTYSAQGSDDGGINIGISILLRKHYQYEFRIIQHRQSRVSFCCHDRAYFSSSSRETCPCFALGIACQSNNRRSQTNNSQRQMVDGSQAAYSTSSCSLFAAKDLRFNRSPSRIWAQGQCCISNLLRKGHRHGVACFRSYQNRNLSQPSILRNTASLGQRNSKSSNHSRFSDPREADFDSTVQEANIAYPSDASLMTKIAGLGSKVIEYLKLKTRGIQDASPTGEAADAACSHTLLRIGSSTPRRYAMGHSASCGADQNTCLALSSGCWPFHSRAHHESWENSFFSCPVCNLHQEGKGRHRQGVWARIPTWTYQRKLPFCSSIQFAEDERQTFICSAAWRTRQTIWQRHPRIGKRGQRVLERQESKGAYQARCQRTGLAATGQSQEEVRINKPRGAAKAAGPPSWYRTIDRSHQAWRATGKKSNEERCGKFSCGVRVCLGLQFEANFESTRVQYEEGSLKKNRKYDGQDFELVGRTKNAMGSASRSIATLWIVSGA